MASYLYGAAVQGIQEFIFRTNKLSDITGASELVERICTQYFEKVLGKSTVNNSNAIINAAGNIKYIFTDKNECEQVVRKFPKYVLTKVPGITISQAVVEYDPQGDFPAQVLELETKLRIQRNRPMRPTSLGLLGIKRSTETGLPLKQQPKGQYCDEQTVAKRGIIEETNKNLCKKAFGETVKLEDVNFNTDRMIGENDWIAIIHADGNGLGQVVQKVSKNGKKAFREFSVALDEANRIAAQKAFERIKTEFNLKDNDIPVRPIVLSGDDFTIICRAEFALEYARYFIENFETETKTRGYDLTACAGIAMIKSSFPFYYGYEMAEELCSKAKKDSKSGLTDQDLAPSSIMFYKIEDSFTENFDDIENRVLTTHTGNVLKYAFGPYYVHDVKPATRWTVQNIIDVAKELEADDKESNAVKSHVRQWLGIRFKDEGAAEQKLNRMNTILSSKTKLIEKLTNAVEGRVPAFDVLALHTVKNQSTK